MKKGKRLIALLLAVVLCFSLAGCAALDEMRANQGFWQKDGSIQLGKYTYKPLPEAEGFSPDFSESKDITVTQPDVPVLLSGIWGDMFSLSKDTLLIEGEQSIYYCRADKYDNVVTRLQEGFTPEEYVYEYEIYNPDTYEYAYLTYVLTAEQVAAVTKVLAEEESMTLPEGTYLEEDVYVDILARTKDKLFHQRAYEIRLVGDVYYVNEAGENDTLTPVPAALQSTFQGIVQAYVSAQEAMEEAFDYEEEDLEYIL